MSMNLYFETLDGVGLVYFPYQTRTDLTYEVLHAKTKEERLKLIHADLVTRGWDADFIESTMKQIKQMMDSPHLQLTMM